MVCKSALPGMWCLQEIHGLLFHVSKRRMRICFSQISKGFHRFKNQAARRGWISVFLLTGCRGFANAGSIWYRSRTIMQVTRERTVC